MEKDTRPPLLQSSAPTLAEAHRGERTRLLCAGENVPANGLLAVPFPKTAARGERLASSLCRGLHSARVLFPTSVPSTVHRSCLLSAVLALALACGCQSKGKLPIIAVIPQMATEEIWLEEHAGVLRAAGKAGLGIYWNGADREDDVQRQISLVDQVAAGRYAGLVLAPSQELALMLPVRRVVERHIPVVIVSSPLTLPPGKSLAYIVNDEQETGALAADAIGRRLHGRGRVALLGIDPMQIGVIERMRAFEQALRSKYPAMRITERKPGTLDTITSKQMAVEALMAEPRVDAALALNFTAALGLSQAEQMLPSRRRIPIVVCGQDGELVTLLKAGVIDTFIAQDAYAMGYQAMQEIVRMRQGLPVPAQTAMKPILVNASNVDDSSVLAHVANLPDEPL